MQRGFLKLIENPTVAYNKFDGNIFYSIVSQVVLGLDNDEYIQDIEYNHILQRLMAITNKAKLLTIELGLTPTKNTYLFQNYNRN